MNNLVHHASIYVVGHDRRWRIGAHAAGIRPLVSITYALVVLRRSECDRGLSVAEREERCLFTDKAILDHDFPSGRAETAAEHHVDGGFGLLNGLRHNHALAGGEPVRFHHDRRAFFAHIILCRARALEAFVCRSWDVVGPA